MQLTAAIQGDLRRIMAEETRILESAAMDAARATADDAKQKLRQQVIAAGLGARTARSWRSDVYPDRAGARSMNPTAYVYSRAPEMMRGHSGTVIQRDGGYWLALPIPGRVPRLIRRRKVTPARLAEHWGIELRIAPGGRPDRRYLVGRVRRRTGQRGGFAAPSARALRTGNVQWVPLFTLHRQVTLPRRMRIDRVAQAAGNAFVPRFTRAVEAREQQVRGTQR